MHACLVQTVSCQSMEITVSYNGGESIMDLNPVLKEERVWTK